MTIKQKEIWLVEFDPQIGYEIKKTRPAIVLSTDIMSNLPIKIIAPITSWQKHFLGQPYKIRLDDYERYGLDNLSAVDCFQIKSFSEYRFKKKIGQVDDKLLFEIHSNITKVFNPLYELTNFIK